MMQNRAVTSWAGQALSVLSGWVPVGPVPVHTDLSSSEHAAWPTETCTCQLPLLSAHLPDCPLLLSWSFCRNAHLGPSGHSLGAPPNLHRPCPVGYLSRHRHQTREHPDYHSARSHAWSGRTSVSCLLLSGGASKSFSLFSAPGECFQHLCPQLPPKGRPMWGPSPTNAPHVGAPSTTYGPFPCCPALRPGWNHTQDLSDGGTVTGLISLLTLRRTSPPASSPLLATTSQGASKLLVALR